MAVRPHDDVIGIQAIGLIQDLRSRLPDSMDGVRRHAFVAQAILPRRELRHGSLFGPQDMACAKLLFSEFGCERRRRRNDVKQHQPRIHTTGDHDGFVYHQPADR